MATASGLDATLMKEEQRIAMKRAANEERRLRFLNARKRVMGIDVTALNAQVAEKAALAEAEKEADRYERVRQMEIDMILEQTNEEEKQMKAYLNEEVRKSWEDMIADQAAANKPEVDLDPLLSGPSAAQNFAGADPYRKERIRNQKAQMRSWVTQQVLEKQNIADADQADRDSYSSMLTAIAEVRDAADKEEKEMQQYLNDTVREENFRLAAAKKERMASNDKEWDDLSLAEKKAATSINLRDNEDIAMDENGRIVRKDQFRGYNAAQIRRIIEENEAFLANKRADAASHANDELGWAMQQNLQQQIMEQAQQEENELRKAELMYNLDVINQQRRDQAEKAAMQKFNRFGTIDKGSLFEKFGSTCR